MADRLSLDVGYEVWRAAQVRPDGMGIWIEGHQRMRSLVEIDTGTEPLTRLREKLGRYAVLAEDLGSAMPWVLFSVAGPKCGRNVRAALRRHSDARTVPVATTHRVPAEKPQRACGAHCVATGAPFTS